jgi:hypothetical protein
MTTILSWLAYDLWISADSQGSMYDGKAATPEVENSPVHTFFRRREQGRLARGRYVCGAEVEISCRLRSGYTLAAG